MHASETKLQQIIEGEKQYVIPLFQRTYSWQEKEWRTLWNDLIELYEMETPRSHSLGSIVNMPAISVPEGIMKYLLIDGQQRLTAIVEFLNNIFPLDGGSDVTSLPREIHNKFYKELTPKEKCKIYFNYELSIRLKK